MYMVICRSIDRSICWFCTPAMTIGFGSEPAMVTRSRAAAIRLLSAASAGLTSPAPRATDCGSLQSTVVECAAIGRNAATPIKRCFKQTSSETHDQRREACGGDQINRTERTDRRCAVGEGGDSDRGAAVWKTGGVGTTKLTNVAGTNLTECVESVAPARSACCSLTQVAGSQHPTDAEIAVFVLWQHGIE